MSAPFNFNKRERNGIIVLTFILLGIILYYLYMPQLFPAKAVQSAELISSVKEFAAYHDSIISAKRMQVLNTKKHLRKQDSVVADRQDAIGKKDAYLISVELRPFNPNEATEDEFGKLGFPNWLAGRIVNYRNKGGKFKVKSDLKRIYGFPDSLYTKVEPFIVLPETPERKGLKSDLVSKEAKRNLKVYDLNKASQEELMELRGIGKAYASRILKYKELLGGFIKKEQLMEVYGFSDSLYYSLEHRVEVLDTMAINPININTVKLGELSRHPYFTFAMAKRMVEYREKKGPYVTVSQIEKEGILNPHLYAKIKPYIRVFE